MAIFLIFLFTIANLIYFYYNLKSEVFLNLIILYFNINNYKS